MPFQPVLTAAAMQQADRRAIERFGIPGFTLMETAGRAAAAAIERMHAPLRGRAVLVLCGRGNNGGDGLVVARVLHARGARVRAVLLADEPDLTESAALNLRLFRQIAGHDGERAGVERFTTVEALDAAPPPEVIVDALLGTGLRRDLAEPVRGVVEWINRQHRPVVALDVPTGLDSDTGEVRGRAVRADLTITMAALKPGLLLRQGPEHAGRVETAEIGLPDFLLEEALAEQGGAYRATDDDVRGLLPRRSADAHKYSVGLVLAVAGSRGLTGAPAMASRAAARAGAGAVVCACPASAQPILAAQLTEVMTLGLPETPSGGLALEGLRDETFRHRLEQARALLVGCGLGRHEETMVLVRELVGSAATPGVLDADGLSAFAGRTDELAHAAAGRWILTPHAGEFRRLAGEEADLSDPISTVRRFARAWNCVLILKGLPSVLGLPDGRVFLNATGNPALATAGTGDVLAGMCAGLLAQGLSPEHAALCALHTGGAAADRYASRRAGGTMLATDLLDQLPRVLHERFRPLPP